MITQPLNKWQNRNIMLFDNTSLEGARQSLMKLERARDLSALSGWELASLEKVVDCWVFTDGMLVDNAVLNRSHAAGMLTQYAPEFLHSFEIDDDLREDLYEKASSYKVILQIFQEPDNTTLINYIGIVDGGCLRDPKLDELLPERILKGNFDLESKIKYWWDRLCMRVGFLMIISKIANLPLSPHPIRGSLILGLHEARRQLSNIDNDCSLIQAKQILSKADEIFSERISDIYEWLGKPLRIERPSMLEWLLARLKKTINGFMNELQDFIHGADVISFREFSYSLFKASKQRTRRKLGI